MQITINGKITEIIPFHLIRDMQYTNEYQYGGTTGSFQSPGSINLNRNWYGYTTDFASIGTYINLKGIYNDWYVENYSQNASIAEEKMFEWSYTDGGGETVTNHFSIKVNHTANDKFITLTTNVCASDDPDYSGGSDYTFKIDYASDQYNYDYLFSLAVVENINCEKYVNNYDVPTGSPEDNGLRDVIAIRGSYMQQIADKAGDDWSVISIINRTYYQPEGCPMYAPYTFNVKVPYTIQGWTGQSLTGLGHQILIWGDARWYIPSYDNLQFNATDPEDLPPAHQDPNDDVNKPSGPPGVYKDVSSRISGPGLPTTSALSTGFIKAYNLSAGQSQSLSAYMLTDSFIQGVKKLMANPIDYVIGFHMIPVKPTTTSHNIIIGGVDTNISSEMITQEYVQYQCGSIQVPEYWGAFIDYSSTKVEIYVPFVGVMPLDIDDVMNATLTLTYNINVLSGACTAFLDCDTARTLHSVIYYWNGNMQSSIPITNNDYSQKLSMMMSGVGQLAGGFASGNAANMGMGAASIIGSVLKKPIIQKAGALAGDVGMLSQFTPFLIVTRPVQALPANYKALNGYASEIGGTVGSFSGGYLEVEQVDLSGIACTDSEKAEIEALLKGGVFV